jgi:hypothetical protein
MREPLVINAAKSIHHSDVSGLGQKRGVIDESPERQQIVDAAGVLVIAKNP